MWTIYGNETSDHTIVAIPALGERKEMFQALANELSDYKWFLIYQEVIWNNYPVIRLRHFV